MRVLLSCDLEVILGSLCLYCGERWNHYVALIGMAFERTIGIEVTESRE